MELIEDSYEVARKRAKDTGVEMPGFNEFWEKAEPIEFPIDEGDVDFVQHGDFREDPLLEPLGTASGKIKIYSLGKPDVGQIERVGAYVLHLDELEIGGRIPESLLGRRGVRGMVVEFGDAQVVDVLRDVRAAGGKFERR